MLVLALAGGAAADTPPCVLSAEADISGAQQQEYCALPQDVRAFVERQASCVHFAGEEPYDAQRRAALERAVRESCQGNERRFAKLRQRHARSADVSAWLERYGRSEELLPSP